MEKSKLTTPHSREEVFLQNLTQIVIDNLANEQFGVSELSQEAGYSRSQLHRKLKSLQKKSASQFIREIRLSQARQLLIQDEGTAAEIAYRVGFGSPAYFNKCFRQHYGFPPGEMKKRQREGSLIPWTRPKAERSYNSFLRSAWRAYSLSRTWKFFSAIALFMGLLYFIFFFANSAAKDQMSIAVLPLDNLSDVPENEYFIQGMHDALIGALGKIGALRVISRSSTLPYAEQEINIQKIAKDLDVDLIVEGSVYGYQDSIRIQLQLIKAFPKEKHLWAQDYHGELPQVLKLHSQAVTDIAHEIEIQLTPNETTKLVSTRSVNPNTYRSYLRGMYYVNKSTADDFKKGIYHLNQAIEHDPADPLAYAGLAMGYAVLGHGPEPKITMWKRAKAAALTAISLDPNLAEAHAVLGIVQTYLEGDWEGAEKSYQRSISLNPNLALSHFNYAWFQVLFGRFDEAFRAHKKAKELDPLTAIYTADLGSLYYWVDQYDRSIEELQEALELSPEFGHAWWAIGNTYAGLGDFEKAISAHKKATRIHPAWSWALGNTYVLAGKMDSARAVITELKTNEVNPRTAFGLAMIYTSMGDFDKAFDWLRFMPQDHWIPWIRTWPDFRPLRDDPRFNAFLKEMNLPPVFPESGEGSLEAVISSR